MCEPPIVREIESPILLPDARRRVTVVSEVRPAHFRIKLSVILFNSLTVLCLPAYAVGRFAAASVRTFIYVVPTADM